MKRRSKTWKKIPEEKWNIIREFLISRGGIQDSEVRGIKEVWRIRIKGTIFTLYETGTLFSTNPEDEVVINIHQEITEIVGRSVMQPSKEFLIGLDETGKGEVLGHCILAGVLFPKILCKDIEEVLGAADTKKKRSAIYWDELYSNIDHLRNNGIIFELEKIPPWHVDMYNLNQIMDLVYQRIINHLIKSTHPDKCRIVLDNYGVGANLNAYLKTLSISGAEIILESHADENYLEARLASVIAKREREKVMEAINNAYSLPEAPVGSGNAADPVTMKWLEEWKKTGKEWPWFVKESFITIRRLEKKEGIKEKIEPPIRHELLSPDSRKKFCEGKLSPDGLTICCPNCGEILKSCKVVPIPGEELVGRCVNCDKIIKNLNTTLLYYCGYVLPDSSVILSGTISMDLERKRFFEGFTFLIHPIVKEECDTKGGRREWDKLAKFSSVGRIRLQELPNNIIKEKKKADDLIVDTAICTGSIIYTRDGSMQATASSKQIFFLKS